MDKLSTKEIANMSGGTIVKNGSVNYANSTYIDSRLVTKNSLFFTMDGTEFDGHDFIPSAVKNGASIIIISKDIDISCYDASFIKVADTLAALYSLAKSYKNNFDIPFIALTGSSGKTTTKDMLAAVLSKKFDTHKTQGNFNSTTGVPLTLLELSSHYEIAVIEMGMNHFGEIEKVSKLVEPDKAIITNIGVTHIENLGSKEGILEAKMEITKGLKQGGELIINTDDNMLSSVEQNNDYTLTKIGCNSNVISASDIKIFPDGITFKVSFKNKLYDFKLNLPGMYNVYNALPCIYLGFSYGIEYKDIYNALVTFTPGKNRMSIEKINGKTIINDTYNSNPDALKEAVSLLSNIGKNNRKIAVLGDMYELGEFSVTEHQKCGEHLAKLDIDYLFTVGKDSSEIISGAVNQNFNKNKTIHFNDKETLIEYLTTFLEKEDYVLFKASRGMELEKVVISLLEDNND